MTPRVSQIAVTLVLLDEFDAPKQEGPVLFAADENGTAAEKAAAFLLDLPNMLANPPAEVLDEGLEPVETA